MAQAIILDHLRVLRVAGDDRTSFLQGQLTQDVARAGTTEAVLAGWADPRGRLLMLAWLYAGADAFHLVLPAALAEPIAKRLKMYVLRARVTVEQSALAVGGVTGGSPSIPEVSALRLPGAAARSLLIGPGERLREVVTGRDGPAAWTLGNIRAGLPEIHPQTSATFVPQMVNLDLLGGISFDKGCYTGQEIVARMRYRGRVRRRMFRFLAAGRPPEPGTAVLGTRGTVGEVVVAAPAEAGCELLAVVCLDDLGQPLHVTDGPNQPLVRADLPYAIPELAGEA